MTSKVDCWEIVNGCEASLEKLIRVGFCTTTGEDSVGNGTEQLLWIVEDRGDLETWRPGDLETWRP
jgi:hypothetical protein